MAGKTTPPRIVLLAILVLSIPFVIAGSLTPARLMPGLPVSALMFLATALVAVGVAYRASGWQGAAGLCRRALDLGRSRPWVWYAVALVVFPAIIHAQLLLLGVSTGNVGRPITWGASLLTFSLFLVAALCEEVAWSGTLLDPIAARVGFFAAAVTLGAFTAFWHMVPFFQTHPSVPWVVGQCVFTIGFRVVVAWVYRSGGRSILAAALCHASYNTTWQLMPDPVSGYKPWLVAALTWGVVFAIVAVFGAQALFKSSDKRIERTP